MQQIAEDILLHNQRWELFPFRFDSGGEAYIKKIFDQPDSRDLLTIRRAAKDGLMSKQMNWHMTGTDGTYSRVMTRGKEIEKRAFDAFRSALGMDAYFIELYENGEKKSHQVPKNIWYCVHDINLLIEREAQAISPERAWINKLSREYTEAYMTGAAAR